MRKLSPACAVLICLTAAAATAPAARAAQAQLPAQLWEQPRPDTSLGKPHTEPATDEPVPPAAVALVVAALLALGSAVRLAPSRAPAAASEPRWWEAPPGPSCPGLIPPPPPPVPERPAAQARPPAAPAPALLILAAAACVVAPPLMLLGAPSWARFPAVLLLLSLAPGTAVLRLTQGRRARLETGLVVCLSLALVVLGAQAAMLFGAWHPALLTCLLAAGCLACLAAPPLHGVASRRAAFNDGRRPGPVDPPPVGATSTLADHRDDGGNAGLWRGAVPPVRVNGRAART